MMDLDEEFTPNKRLRFLNRSAKTVSTSDILALFAVGTFLLHIITFFILLLIYASYSQLNKKAPPSLVLKSKRKVLGSTTPTDLRTPFGNVTVCETHLPSKNTFAFLPTDT